MVSLRRTGTMALKCCAIQALAMLKRRTSFGMTRLDRGSSGEGRRAQPYARDRLEAGMPRYLLRLPGPMRLSENTSSSLPVVQLPTHTVRSEDQIRCLARPRCPTLIHLPYQAVV